MEKAKMSDIDKSLNKKKSAFAGHILAVEINDFFPSGESSSKSRSRVIPNILHLLDHIDKHRAEGNFYITLELMKDFPEIISLVSSRGHEIGLCCDCRSSDCLADIASYKKELEQIAGCRSSGIMLKTGSGDKREMLKEVAANGFYYSLTDYKPSPREYYSQPIKVMFNDNTVLNVFPSSQYKFCGMMIKFGQPGKIRLYPYWFLRRCLRYFTHRNIPAIINFPLWEFDPHLPRQALGPLQSLKSYGNLTLAEFKLTRLLLEFDFIRVTKYLELEDDAENL